MSRKREAWHYDATKGRPAWSKEMAKRQVLLRQQEKDWARAATRPVTTKETQREVT